MKNMLYFAVFDCTASVPSERGLAFGGFGFTTDGSIRAPYPLPPSAVLLLDDSILPGCVRPAVLQEFLCENNVETVIFDFEKPKTESLCALIQSVREVQTVVPPAYAALRHDAVMLPPYHPREPFMQYLQRWRKKERCTLLDLSPLQWELSAGKWRPVEQQMQCSGCFTAKNQCLYCTRQTKNGTVFRFFDTQKSLLGRCDASKQPCIVPLTEFLQLPEK